MYPGGQDGLGGAHAIVHEPFVTGRHSGEHPPIPSGVQPATQPGFAGQYWLAHVVVVPLQSPGATTPHAGFLPHASAFSAQW